MKTDGRIVCKCQHCGINFKRYPSHIKDVKNIFCSRDCHDNFRVKTITKSCIVCGNKWTSVGADNPTYRRLTCGKKCQLERVKEGLMMGWGWNHKGGRLTTQGYMEIRSPDHPHKDSNGYVKRSRLVMENKLGRYLKPTEVVHHIDRNKLNDDAENLKLFSSNSDHIRFHYENGDCLISGVTK